MNNDSRTKNFIRNAGVSVLTQFLSIILSFANRTVFIKILNENYLGINGVFSNILSMLSFVELGFGTAIIYFMYKPVADNDENKIKSLVYYYKKVYFVIGIIMFVLGLMVIPFMPFIIKDAPNIPENLNLIYILFLFNTSIGYFYSHKTAIINAHQKNYIISIYNQVFKWLQLLGQIIILLLTKNYILYLVIQCICTIINNIFISFKANKMYPYLKSGVVSKLNSEEKKKMNNKVKSLIFYKLNPAILNGSDNLIMSAFCGIGSVGIYSNYYLITSYINMFLNQITGSLETGIGNLNAEGDKEKKEEVFYKVLYLCFILFGGATILIYGLAQDFIKIWVGEKYLFSNFTLFTILLYIYINGVTFATYSFRTTSGLFEKTKIVPLIEIILNVFISIVLTKLIGVPGVFLGTSIARLLTFFWTDAVLLYSNLFNKKNIVKYFIKYIYYTFVTFLSGVIVSLVSNNLIVTDYFTLFCKAIILGIITIILYTLLTIRTSEFKYYFNVLKTRVKKGVKKNEKNMSYNI